MVGTSPSILTVVALLVGCASWLQGCSPKYDASAECTYTDQTTSSTVVVTIQCEGKNKAHTSIKIDEKKPTEDHVDTSPDTCDDDYCTKFMAAYPCDSSLAATGMSGAPMAAFAAGGAGGMLAVAVAVVLSRRSSVQAPALLG